MYVIWFLGITQCIFPKPIVHSKIFILGFETTKRQKYQSTTFAPIVFAINRIKMCYLVVTITKFLFTLAFIYQCKMYIIILISCNYCTTLEHQMKCLKTIIPSTKVFIELNKKKCLCKCHWWNSIQQIICHRIR